MGEPLVGVVEKEELEDALEEGREEDLLVPVDVVLERG